MRSDNIGSHYQNSDNFLMYVGLKFPDLVVCLNDFLRLDEEGLACCRLIVDNAFHCPLVHWCSLCRAFRSAYSVILLSASCR